MNSLDEWTECLYVEESAFQIVVKALEDWPCRHRISSLSITDDNNGPEDFFFSMLRKVLPGLEFLSIKVDAFWGLDHPNLKGLEIRCYFEETPVS